MSEPVLQLENISKAFRSVPAVRDVSFTIEPGSIVGFLGPNGAGKTTTLRIALGLMKPDQGSVTLFGARDQGPSYGRVGFLPEERGLYRKMKARNAIAYIAALNGLNTKTALKRADELLAQYGLADAGRKKISTLSKGMAQKVQVIAAVAHNPEFLVLDEPFSGLDPINQKLLESMVRDAAQGGRTVIFSTHVMEHAERLCDKIILMSHGHKIFDGDLNAALSHAPRKLLIVVDGPNALAVLEPFANWVEDKGEGLFQMELKPGIPPETVLKTVMASPLQLLRFEPDKPRLHDAFVSLVDAQDAGRANGRRRTTKTLSRAPG